MGELNGDKIQVGLRISETLKSRVQKEADKMGISFNAAVLVFTNIGLTVAEHGFTVAVHTE